MSDPSATTPPLVYAVTGDTTDEELEELAALAVVELTLAARAQGQTIPTPEDLPDSYKAQLEPEATGANSARPRTPTDQDPVCR